MTGLLVLVVVGAWLAVLVPMALRSHDTTSFKSSERHRDAMRVLSRKTPRDVLVPRRSYSSLVVSETKSQRAPRIPEERLVDETPVPLSPARTAAERRLRTLLVLVGTALVTLGLALFGVPAARWLHVLCDLLLVGFVVHLRRQAILKAERAARQRARQRATARPAAAAAPAAPRVTGIPDRMPKRPEPLGITLPAPAARYDDAAPVTVDTSWSPVPVPPPVYVGKAKAPSRPPRVLDLTKPGEWTAALEDAGLDILEEGPELEEILDRRRVAGDW